jgi:hypothetical protein
MSSPRLSISHSVVLVVLAGLWFLSGRGLWAQAAPLPPTKLDVKPRVTSLVVGETTTFDVILRDANNRVTKASRDIRIDIEVKLPTGTIQTLKSVLINKGDSNKSFTLKPDTPGLIQVKAKQPQLLEGGTFVYVASKKRTSSRLEPFLSPRFSRDRGIVFAQNLQPASPTKHTLLLRASPERTLLADGKDAATVHVFLVGENPPSADIQVQLFSSHGTLDPQTIRIPRGETSGAATLTSDSVGVARVEVIDVQPPPGLEVRFGPPITTLRFLSRPSKITLVDDTDLIVELQDVNGHTVATDENRSVFFALEKGRGVIHDSRVDIAAGLPQARTTFKPTWWGKMQLAASTPALDPFPVVIDVDIPVALLALSAMGGLLGGLIAYWRKPTLGWWRVLVGLVTGFLLYCVILLGILAHIQNLLAVNPLSALACSVLGGWLGTGVFDLLGASLGFAKTPTG